jgi:two-component system, chemotaxis family, protein-glutamate methylesterase/glutaminase
MRRKRVLVVDDSVVVRRSLTRALARTADVLVVGSAASGHIALMKIPLLRPDVVALAVDMPAADGPRTLSAIRAAYPTLPVIMLNPAPGTGRGASAGSPAAGAVAWVTKPALAAHQAEEWENCGDELAAKILRVCREEPCFPGMGPEPVDEAPPSDMVRTEVRVDVLAIAVSTGGPSALMDLIPRFPKDFPVPIVIVQHMPPAFTTLLAERLTARSSIRVVEGCAHQTLAPGCASIAPGDFHMAVVRDGEAVRLQIHKEPPENSCRPAADVLFRSVARVYGRHVLAVVMTGMGRDGFIGCERIRAAGGQVIVQDKESSVVWGMPGFVVTAGLADQILPLSALGPEILRRVWNHRRRIALPRDTSELYAPHTNEGGRR